MADDPAQTAADEDFDDDSILSSDGSSPFSEPDDQEDHLDNTHPATDSNVDTHEIYDEGLAAAAEVDLPDDPSVVGYTPPHQKGEEE